jgi:hypothetical protein
MLEEFERGLLPGNLSLARANGSGSSKPASSVVHSCLAIAQLSLRIMGQKQTSDRRQNWSARCHKRHSVPAGGPLKGGQGKSL